MEVEKIVAAGRYKETIVRRFASTAEVGRLAQKIEIGQFGTNNSAWFGGVNREQAIEKCFTGDLGVVAKASAMIENIQAILEVEQCRWALAPVGAFPSVPDFVAGHPDNMRVKLYEPDDRAPIRIFASSTSSAEFSGEQLTRRGTAVLALVMGLSMVRAVTLYSVSGIGSTTYDGAIYVTEIPAAPLELSTACFALSHPGFARGINYRVGYELDNFDGSWPFSGDPNGSTDIAAMKSVLHCTASDLFVPPIYIGDSVCYENPAQWVREKLALFGIEA